MTHRTERTVNTAPRLFRELLSHARELWSAEFHMARVELSQAANAAGKGAVYLAIALLFALVAFHALALTGVLALSALGIPLVWAALITSVLVLVIAATFGALGSYGLKKSAQAPKRTLANLRNDLSSFEEATRV